MYARRAIFKAEDKMTNTVVLARTNDIQSWWEVPCIAHFCSLFRASFNLIDFDIEDLEGALLTDDVPHSENTLIRELMVRLLRGYYENNSISASNYPIFLRRLFRQKCRDFKCFNPLDNDVDFKLLPLRTKVEVLLMLCDFRLDANDVLDILKNLDSDSLRVRPLGFDANKSAYWYFYGTRLYREDYPKKNSKKKRGRKSKRGINKEIESGEEGEVDLGSGIWQVVCFSENDWKRLAVSMKKAKDSDEKMLYQIINDDFLPEIPKLFQEKARLQRRRLIMLNPRKSSRLEILKRRREEEGRTSSLDSESEADSEINTKKNKNERLERLKNRNMQKGVSFQSDNENSNSESLSGSDEQGSNTSNGNQMNVRRSRRVRNSEATNSEPADEKSVRKDSSSECVDMNLLHEGMYQVLSKLKGHEDSWLFLEPVGDEQEASPVSLQSMENKLEAEKYRTLVEFEQDFYALLDKLNEQYNCWRMEYASLEKFFNDNVNQYLSGYESADKMSFRNEQKKKRRKPLLERCSNDADKENEHQLTDVTSVESEIYNVEEPSNIESRISELHPIKRGKGRPPKNASTLHALDIVTEQTLRDVMKLLDDAPKCKEFCPSPSPPYLTPYNCDSVTEIPVIEESISMCQPAKQKNSSKKRTISTRESHQKHLQLMKGRRRDSQRTIDRLQPGKSKGNLISTTTRSRITNGEKSAFKESMTNRTENGSTRPKPMLSLGSVLSSDAINLDTTTRKHTFPENDSLSSDEETFSENDDSVLEERHQTEAENLAVDKFSSTALLSAKKADDKSPDLSVTETSEKPKPNLGAWFKAFGTPKPHPSPKKKTVTQDGGAMQPKLFTRHGRLTIPSACNLSSEKSFNNEDDFPNPAIMAMNHSIQSYQPPVSLKVGFYQDTFSGPNFVSSPQDSVYGPHIESIASPKDHNSLPTASLQYQSETVETFKPSVESPFSKYPMKKRISAELERRSAIESDTYRYSLTPAAPLPPTTYADEAPSIPISYNSNYSESYPHLPESALVHHQYPTYPHPQQAYECYSQQCYPQYTVPHENALNYSNKNLQHSYYADNHEYHQAAYEIPRGPDIYHHNLSYCNHHVDYMNANQMDVRYPHYETAVRNESLNYSNERLPPKSEGYSPQPPQPPSKPRKKTRKRKTAAEVVEPPPAQEPGSAFNFSGASLVNSEYQQQCIEKLRNPQLPVTSSAYAHQGAPTSCSCGNQPYPCPSSIYSSPYLQRPSDELLRHGLVPVTHTADYSSGYVGGHEAIHRSPWL